MIVIDYNVLDNTNSYREVIGALEKLDICILVNNQTYSVPFDLARADLLHD